MIDIEHQEHLGDLKHILDRIGVELEDQTITVNDLLCLHHAWLKSQGIPIDKLLSGEMVAVPVEPTFEMVDDACYSSETKQDVYHPDIFPGGAQGAHDDFTARYKEALKQAKADYAGNKPVEP